MRLPTLPADKANHLIYGALVFLAAGAAARLVVPGEDPRIIGAAAAGAVGLLWEGWQRWLNRRAARQQMPPPHSVDPLDAFATLCGGLLCWLASVVVL